MACAIVTTSGGPAARATEGAQSGHADGTRSELRRLATDQGVRRFYELQGWRLSWTAQSTTDLSAALRAAPRHALSPDFAILDRKDASTASEDIQLTSAALSYAGALASGAVSPTSIHSIFTLARNQPDLAAGLVDALRAGGVAAWLEALAPNTPEYRALSSAYEHEASAIGQGQYVQVPAGRPIKTGDRDMRVALLRRALADDGYDVGEGMGDVYDAALAAAVKAMQAEYGLTVDGVVGPRTLAQLNAGPFARARQLAVNMERLRWLRRDVPKTRIDVNIASTQLLYYLDGVLAVQARVVAGSRSRKTPLLGESFSQLVVNPPWHVPQSIARTEILPRGAGYLARHNMYLSHGRVVQRPGARSALGLVKFDMRNRYAIYLHDTPSKAIFGRAARHRSHGCVRVDDAVGFARRLASDNGREQAFESALASGRTRVVKLGTDIPVRLLYQTAYLEAGRVRYRSDAYGWDDQLAAKLGLGKLDGRRTRANASILFGP